MANQISFNETNFRVGDTIRVYHKIKEKAKEGEKTRIQIFEGVVISIQGSATGKSFIVRKMAIGSIGVERIWPIICPSIDKITVVKKGDVRRAKLFYLRNRIGREANKVKDATVSKPVKKPVSKEAKKTNTNAAKKLGKTGRKTGPKISSK